MFVGRLFLLYFRQLLCLFCFGVAGLSFKATIDYVVLFVCECAVAICCCLSGLVRMS